MPKTRLESGPLSPDEREFSQKAVAHYLSPVAEEAGKSLQEASETVV